MINNILKYKTPIKNIFLKTLPLLVWFNISYSVNNLNNQLKKQIIEMEHQSQLILTLQEEVFYLKNAVIHKEKEVQDILNKLSTVNLKNSEVTTQLQNAELLIAQNDMTQFYIKTAGVVCVVGLGIIFITGIKSYFNFSFLIPTSFKHVIQDYTPFLQTKEFYALHDNANNLNWVVNVLNKKYVEILIKTKGFSGYVPVFEYISNLQKDVDSMTSLTKNSNNTENTSESLTTPLEIDLTVSNLQKNDDVIVLKNLNNTETAFESLTTPLEIDLTVSNLQKNADVITLKDLNNTETVFKSSTTPIKTIDRITLQTDSPADPNYSSDAVNAAVDRIMAFIS